MKKQTWQARVQTLFESQEELATYDKVYKIVRRCHFNSVQEMWNANPLIGGEVRPQDFNLIQR